MIPQDPVERETWIENTAVSAESLEPEQLREDVLAMLDEIVRLSRVSVAAQDVWCELVEARVHSFTNDLNAAAARLRLALVDAKAMSEAVGMSERLVEYVCRCGVVSPGKDAHARHRVRAIADVIDRTDDERVAALLAHDSHHIRFKQAQPEAPGRESGRA